MASDSSTKSYPTQRRSRPAQPRPLRWMGAAFILFVVATMFAVSQPPSDGGDHLSWLDLAWWTRPIERNTFMRLTVVAGSLPSVDFVDGQRGWAVGEAGTIVGTTDGGVSWHEQTSGTNADLSSVDFVDGQRGWAVGNAGTIIATIDGGVTWRKQFGGARDDLYSLAFTDEKHGWAVGARGAIIATTDGGASWQHQTTGTESDLHSVAFADQQHGWAVGDRGAIIATTDGGASWLSQTNSIGSIGSNLHSVAFTDRQHGYAVGDRGAIIATSDGGARWQDQTAGTESDLHSVAFADRQHGWAVGDRGAIIATTDGGASWHNISGTSADLRSVAFANGRQGWAAGEDGTIIVTTDGGATWNWQTSGTRYHLSSVTYADLQHGWAVGDEGTIIATTDGGATWHEQTRGKRPSLHSVAFADLLHGWAVGDAGTVIATTDGGVTWHRQPTGVGADLYSVVFVGWQHGWAVGDYGAIIATTDGGATWDRQDSSTRYPLNSVAFADRQHGWAVGYDGTIVATTDSGVSWYEQVSRTKSPLYSVAFVDGQRGWAVGAGTVITTTDSGATWRAQVSGTGDDLYSVRFADGRSGWVVGEAGTIISTNDGGATWREHVSGTGDDLNSVDFASGGQFGWAVGDSGTIIATTDAGATWRAAASYRVYPAPWFWLSLVPIAFLVWRGLRKPAPEIQPESIAGRLVSDRPLGDRDFDALNLREVARGLSQFFRNINTIPPLTVAIVGDWGFGKSSLMRLIEADLKKNRVRPVWFNAWHHQTEDQLLAYLLEAIREQAVPAILTPTGIRFRLYLLWSRPRYWPVFLIGIGLFAFGCGLILSRQADFGSWGAFVTSWMLHLISAGSLIGGFFGLRKQLEPFGSSPATLLKTAARGVTIQALEAKTSFRMAFQRQFRDVTQALAPNQMVIFIDDLDRCNPDRVLQILEAVSFLVSSGDCFVVLGIAKKIVLASVGLAFEKIANEVAATTELEVAKETRERVSRHEFAENYLHKLINLEVLIRPQSLRQAQSLLTETGESRPATPAEKVIDWARRRSLVVVAILAVAIPIGSFLTADRIAPSLLLPQQSIPSPESVPMPSPTPAPVPSERPSPTAAVRTMSAKRPTAAVRPTAVARRTTSHSTYFRAGAPRTVRNWWYAVFGTLLIPLLLVASWVLTRRPDTVIPDSQTFREALEVWSNVIAEQYPSPREIKRFLNFVRYLAMRGRTQEGTLSPLERAINFVAARIARNKVEPKSAIEAPQPEKNPNTEAQIVCMALLAPLPRDDRNRYQVLLERNDALAAALVRHQERFQSFPADDEWVWYDDVGAEISVR
jgi:photosystem II stability/assembly factor-like uncharacterized protein